MRFAVLLCFPALHLMAAPFGIQVVDDATGSPVPMVTLETVHGLRFVTDSGGWVAFDEPGLMERRVYFSVRSPGYAFPKDNFGFSGLAFDIKGGDHATIKLARTQIAERLYRATGQGIYNETLKMAKEVPLPKPSLNGGALLHGGTQAALFSRKIAWLWGESSRPAHPMGNARGAMATSDLPGVNGLFPQQGVHFTYEVNDRDEPQSIMPGKEAGSLRFDGLITVRDNAGAEHLIVHYEQLSPESKRTEHGLAEWSPGLKVFEKVTVLGDEYTWQCPQGQAVHEPKENKFYFACPFGLVRVDATYQSVLTPSTYEALSYDEKKGTVRWQQSSPPMTREDEDKWMTKRYIKWKETKIQTVDADTDAELTMKHGSLRYSAFTKTWVFIGCDAQGDVWCCQSANVDGMWHKAVRVATHGGASFDEICQPPQFMSADGRQLYFLGTYRDAAMPRYHGTQVMYRLDLGDERLSATKPTL